MTGELAALDRRFGPEHLEPLVLENGISGTVVVQARHSLDETRELLAIAKATPFVAGVVGWLDLTGDVPAQLATLDGPLVGVRHQVHDEVDPDWLLQKDVQRGIASVGEAGLAFDLLVRPRETPAAIETVRAHPETRFVLDHAGKRPAKDESWRQGVQELAGFPNVNCKLSGLFSESEPADTVERALEWFGADRCMYGSDWPVCLLASDYVATLAVVGTDPNVLGLTAVRTYGLENIAAGLN
jgi:L-fuconolactonase